MRNESTMLAAWLKKNTFTDKAPLWVKKAYAKYGEIKPLTDIPICITYNADNICEVRKADTNFVLCNYQISAGELFFLFQPDLIYYDGIPARKPNITLLFQKTSKVGNMDKHAYLTLVQDTINKKHGLVETKQEETPNGFKFLRF